MFWLTVLSGFEPETSELQEVKKIFCRTTMLFPQPYFFKKYSF